MGSQGKALMGSHVLKPLVRSLGLAVGLGFGASEAVRWCHSASGGGERVGQWVAHVSAGLSGLWALENRGRLLGVATLQ